MKHLTDINSLIHKQLCKLVAKTLRNVTLRHHGTSQNTNSNICFEKPNSCRSHELGFPKKKILRFWRLRSLSPLIALTMSARVPSTSLFGFSGGYVAPLRHKTTGGLAAAVSPTNKEQWETWNPQKTSFKGQKTDASI